MNLYPAPCGASKKCNKKDAEADLLRDELKSYFNSDCLLAKTINKDVQDY